MNIVFHTTPTDYYTPPAADDKPRRCIDKTTGNFDTVSISRTQTVADDSEFASVLTKKAAKELTYEASPEHVKTIRKQIAAGAYKPDPERIAERLLGYR